MRDERAAETRRGEGRWGTGEKGREKGRGRGEEEMREEGRWGEGRRRKQGERAGGGKAMRRDIYFMT